MVVSLLSVPPKANRETVVADFLKQIKSSYYKNKNISSPFSEIAFESRPSAGAGILRWNRNDREKKI
jgi:hypothetical protein